MCLRMRRLSLALVVLSVRPEILEPRRRQLRVAHGVRNIAVAQPVLEGASVVAGVG